MKKLIIVMVFALSIVATSAFSYGIWSDYCDYLDSAESMSNLQRMEKWKDFEGRQVTVRGTLNDAGYAINGRDIYVSLNVDGRSVKVLVNKDNYTQVKRISSLRKGESVSCTGYFKSLGDLMHDVTLGNGSID
ncbi:MAG: hypothetical protein K6E31_08995 [bacterium]|nr:hypothetical protein [bacterium]